MERRPGGDTSDSEDTLSIEAEDFKVNENFRARNRPFLDKNKEGPEGKTRISQPSTLSDPYQDLSLGSLMAKAGVRESKSPSVSRMRVRENRSPSKVYEDTLIMERKIRSFGLFSEDLEWILMGLLKDNDEMKCILKIGFKEVEREMQEMDDYMKNESKLRLKDINEMKHLLNNQYDIIEEKMHQAEKECQNRHSDLSEQCQNLLKDMESKFIKEIQTTLNEKIPEMEEKVNDMNAKMSLAFSDQRGKIEELNSRLEKEEKERKQKMSEEKEEITKLIDNSIEDTTKAVVMLRNDLKKEKVSHNIDMLDVKSIVKKDIDDVGKFIKKVEDDNLRIDSKFTDDIECIQNALKEKEEKILKNEENNKNNLWELKNDLAGKISNQEKFQKEEFSNVKEALGKTIEKSAEDIEKLDKTLNDENIKFKNAIRENDNKIADNKKEHKSNVETINGKLSLQNSNLRELSEGMKQSINKIKTDFESNLNDNESNIASRIQSVKDEAGIGMERIRSDLERETKRIDQNTEKEKNDMMDNVKSLCSKLEANIQNQLKNSNNNIQTLDYRLSNERKEVELRLKEDMNMDMKEDMNGDMKEDMNGDQPSSLSNNQENPFVQMYNHLRKKMENAKNKAAEDLKTTQENQTVFEESIIKKQEEISDLFDREKDEGRQKAEEARQMLKNEMKENQDGIVSKLAGLEKEVISKQEEGASVMNKLTTSLETKMKNFILDVRRPLSVLFTAYRDIDYGGMGEEYLSFTDCSVNLGLAMDPKEGRFTVPLSGLYLLSLNVCSQARKKVLMSIRKNDQELASVYDQNHVENNKNSMSGQLIMADLTKGDVIKVYMYTSCAISDKRSNHFTQFSGLLLRPGDFD